MNQYLLAYISFISGALIFACPWSFHFAADTLYQSMLHWIYATNKYRNSYTWLGISVKIIDFSHRWIILAIAKFDFRDD